MNVAVSIVEALKEDGGLEAFCVQSMNKNGLESICKRFSRDKKSRVCAFGAGEEFSGLSLEGLVDFAIEENPQRRPSVRRTPISQLMKAIFIAKGKD